jgi:Sulfotransferase family
MAALSSLGAVRTVPGQPAVLDRRSRIAQTVLWKIAGLPILPSAGRYNLTISHEQRFLWFRVAKAGNRTILNHLTQNARPMDAPHAIGVHYCPRLYTDYFKFAFVRNPWDRLVSCWNDKVVVKSGGIFGFSESQAAEMLRFENFVDFVSGVNVKDCDPHLRLQCEAIDLNNVDYLGRLETFEADFREICGRLGIPCDAIESRNVHPRKHYREYYTDELREKVARIYQRDVQIFGYKF